MIESKPDVQLIATGNFSTIFLNKSSEPFVIKQYNKQELVAFHNEVRALKRVTDHSNIIQIYSFCHLEANLQLEFIDGYSLAEAIQTITNEQIIEMIKDICKALIHLQSIGVLHNDIKPQNIMYSTVESRWKLIDFGCAQIIEDQEKSETANDLHTQKSHPKDNFKEQSNFGTISYMPKERYTKENGIDTRSDLWSLGIVVLQSLKKGNHPHNFYDCSLDYFAIYFDLDDFKGEISPEWYLILKTVLLEDKNERIWPSELLSKLNFL